MYDDLVRDLRVDADWAEKNPDFTVPTILLYEMRKAADAIEERDKHALTLQHEMMAEAESHIALVERLNKRIEELELHYCPHAIRNVHDRGDDSLCGVLGTEPPKEEARKKISPCYSCANKNLYEPKFGYFGCIYSGSDCNNRDYPMYRPKKLDTADTEPPKEEA